ncbi:MAG TPA: LacI family DNA-binding transcriptional regulator, partial [Burkholderiaceae bacterium]|nr:LacI family DNA-binding transcriptional regulator [Burkholderiaceae bacterium]
GVSPITVSRAINTPDRVSAEKLIRVRQAVQQSGYVPNLLAGGLASRHSRLVAAIIPEVSSPLFADTVHALTEELRTSRYQLALGLSGYGDAREDELVEAMLSRRPDGVVLTGSEHSAVARQRLLAAGIPVVELWDRRSGPIDMAVGFSQEEVGQAVAEALLTGRRRPAFISSDDPLALQRAQGFREAAQRLGITRVPMRMVTAPATLGGGRSSLAALLQEHPDLDAVACSSDMLALGVLIEARARQVAVPDKLAVFGFGDMSFAADTDPPLSTVRVDAKAIGRQAARLILDQAEGRPIKQRILDTRFEIVRRASA